MLVFINRKIISTVVNSRFCNVQRIVLVIQLRLHSSSCIKSALLVLFAADHCIRRFCKLYNILLPETENGHINAIRLKDSFLISKSLAAASRSKNARNDSFFTHTATVERPKRSTTSRGDSSKIKKDIFQAQYS